MSCSAARLRVLVVVDGYGKLRELIEQALVGAGYLPCPASTAAGALAQTMLCRPAVAIVDEAIERSRQAGSLVRVLREQGVPVIGVAGTGECDALRLAGARECVEKPFGRDALIAAVQRALELPEVDRHGD